jgi:sporulation protein YlmC with PRC-barrel domain
MHSAKATLLSVVATVLVALPASGFAQTNPPVRSEQPMFVAMQPQGQWSASQFLGQAVTNPTGENIGDINDLLFDSNGRIVTAVIGVGGFLGLGEKNVAVQFDTLSITPPVDGKRTVKVSLSKEQLKAAPEFKPTEKTAYMRARETAAEMGQKAVDKARELGDKASKKIEEMRK